MIVGNKHARPWVVLALDKIKTPGDIRVLGIRPGERFAATIADYRRFATDTDASDHVALLPPDPHWRFVPSLL